MMSLLHRKYISFPLFVLIWSSFQCSIGALNQTLPDQSSDLFLVSSFVAPVSSLQDSDRNATKQFESVNHTNQTGGVHQRPRSNDNLNYLRPPTSRKYAQPLDEHELHVQVNDRLVAAYTAFYSDLQIVLDAFQFKLSNNAESFLKNVPLSDRCFRSVLAAITALKSHHPAVLQMIDSFGKIPAGLLQGTSADLGDFQECQDVTFESTDSASADLFLGKYCLLTLQPLLPPQPSRLSPHQPLLNLTGSSLQNTILEKYSLSLSHFYSAVSFNFGICVPSTCTRSEIQHLLFQLLSKLKVPVQSVQINSRCSVRDQKWSLVPLQLGALSVLVISLTLVVLATVLDCCARRRWMSASVANRRLVRLVVCFSAVTNTLALFPRRKFNLIDSDVVPLPRNLHKARNSIISLNLPSRRKWSTITSGSSDSASPHKLNLKFVATFRLFSVIWLVLVSNYMFGGYFRLLYVYKNTHSVLQGLSSPFIQVGLLSGHLSVDSLLFLSALLNAVSISTSLSTTSLPFRALFGPLIRRCAVHWAAMLGAQAVFISSLSLLNGPVGSNEQLHYLRICQQGWWSNLLFVSNWFPSHALCNFAGWPISVHAQLLLLSPIVIFTLNRNIRVGIRLCVVLMIGGALISAIACSYYQVQPALTAQQLLDQRQLDRFVSFFLMPTYQHLVPYVFGLLTGFLVHRCYVREFQLHKSALLGTCSALGLVCLFVLLIPLSWSSQAPSSIVLFLYAFSIRLLWSAFLAACVFTVLAIRSLKVALSWSRLRPLCQLLLCASLLHLTPIYLRYFNLRHTREWSHVQFMSGAIVDAFVSLCLAFLLHLFFERPARSMCQQAAERSTRTLVHINNLTDVQC